MEKKTIQCDAHNKGTVPTEAEFTTSSACS
jgi:hypothetical protein